MKKEIVEYLGFEEDELPKKVGRPKLADKKTKKKSLVIASLSFLAVTMLLVFGYGTLFGFNSLNLVGNVTGKNTSNEVIKVEKITPIIKDVTLKIGMAKKVYLTVYPANASNMNIEYESANPEVAIVDELGNVTGIKEGRAKIIARTTDGTGKTTTFNIKVVKDAKGKCIVSNLNKVSTGINYEIECSNAQIKQVQYKVGNEDYMSLLSKKAAGEVDLSKEQLKEKIVLKVVYYPNNSKVSSYSTKELNDKTTTKSKKGNCDVDIKNVTTNSVKYDVSCSNATPTKIAYKIGNGSYVGIETGNVADTILFEESDITRIIYFNVQYQIDGTDTIKSITRNAIIQKSVKE